MGFIYTDLNICIPLWCCINITQPQNGYFVLRKKIQRAHDDRHLLVFQWNLALFLKLSYYCIINNSLLRFYDTGLDRVIYDFASIKGLMLTYRRNTQLFLIAHRGSMFVWCAWPLAYSMLPCNVHILECRA